MTRSVLLVDDAPTIRSLVRMVLECDGGFLVVAEAGDGEEAIQRAREHRPDLILLDLSMPRMGGLEALPHLQAAVPGARVVVFTGFEDPAVAASARRAGAARVLHKGLGGEALRQELHRIADAPLEAPAPRRTGRARPGRSGPLHTPRAAVAVASLLVLLSVYGVAVGGGHSQEAYGGAFEHAAFREPGLAGSVQPFTVVVPTLDLRWTVEPDGAVTMVSSGASWPEARTAFTDWYGARGHGGPTFGALALTTPGGEVHDRDELV